MTRSIALAAGLSLFLSAVPSIARADVPSPSACNTAGEACHTAGDNFNQAGTCVASTCTHNYPGPNGMVANEYACNVCQVSGSAAPPTTITTPSATSNGAPVPTVAPSSASQKSGCNLAATAREDFLLGALTVGAAFVFRKRRRPSSSSASRR